MPHRKRLDAKPKNVLREKRKKRLDDKPRKKLVYVQRQKQKLNVKQKKPQDLKLNAKPLVFVLNKKKRLDNVQTPARSGRGYSPCRRSATESRRSG